MVDPEVISVWWRLGCAERARALPVDVCGRVERALAFDHEHRLPGRRDGWQRARVDGTDVCVCKRQEHRAGRVRIADRLGVRLVEDPTLEVFDAAPELWVQLVERRKLLQSLRW